MKYYVCARWWNAKFESRFGEQYSEHNLSDEEVVNAIITYGRADIIEANGDAPRKLEFQNDYD
jgi:hypothetical protein